MGLRLRLETKIGFRRGCITVGVLTGVGVASAALRRIKIGFELLGISGLGRVSDGGPY